MAQRLVRKPENETLLEELEEGDLIEFPRGAYSHWGVYVGNEAIVHLTGINVTGTGVDSSASNIFTICGIGFKKAIAKVENFWNVVGDSKARKNNGKDKKAKPFSKGEIVKRAMSKLGEMDYSVFWSNCEHFASWCRYDINWSSQADRALLGIVLVGAALTIGYGLKEVYKEKRN